jgi:galactokinase/mevalonate kinase-like predicted kinase
MTDKICVSAPGRCGIIGNPTDMYGGSVISCSITYRAHVTVEPCDHLELDCSHGQLIVEGPEDLALNGDHFDVARAVLEYFYSGGEAAQGMDRPCCRISYSSEVPIGAGVSSSTALTVSILYALLRFKGLSFNLYRVAEIARYIELNHFRIVCGYQDAYMCTFGGLNYMDFRGKQFYRQASEELYATIEGLTPFVPRLPFVLAHTGISHSSDAVHRPLRERWLEGDPEVRQGYEEIARLAREGKKALLLQDWGRLGLLMNENHAIQRDLGGSGEANEKLIRVALEHGALGAKLAGAGKGGTIIALHLEPEEMIAALREAGCDLIFYPHPAAGVRLEPEGEAPNGGETVIACR